MYDGHWLGTSSADQEVEFVISGGVVEQLIAVIVVDPNSCNACLRMIDDGLELDLRRETPA